MIDFKEFKLDNGLQVIVHEDHTVSVAIVNLLYKVGSRDEDPAKTGFAHLFEHLMFGGSRNVPNYDSPLQLAGGDNNAFTTPDLTNYYITLPADNLETAFWLESDRMLSLSFDPNVLEVQRKVVIEEFKQRYLNQPYGDLWHRLRQLAYQHHPYRWPTIGKDVAHIENATMDDVKDFFNRFYCPDNAVLVVAGNVQLPRVKQLAEKWFGDIPAGTPAVRNLPAEPPQKEKKYQEVYAKVPVSAFHKVYHMCAKHEPDYIATDLLSDILGRGKSSRLYESLVKEQKIFSSLGASISGSLDPGLFIIAGKLNEGANPDEAEQAVNHIVNDLQQGNFSNEELQKVKNQAESTLAFSELEVFSRAVNLAVSGFIGDTSLVNATAGKIEQVNRQDIERLSQQVLREENSTIMWYHPEKA